MNHPLLQIDNLSVNFVTPSGITSAIRNISFAVNKGETVAVVGESGSGKTVTSLSILQLLPSPPAKYTSGKIFFSEDGIHTADLLQLPEDNIRKIRGNKISMIFQEPMTSLNPVKKCGAQVMEALLLHKKISVKAATQKTIELFNQVKLPDPASMVNRYPHQLSGGQKQRVMIAMAMSCEPSLLIADEPTTALDVTVQKTIIQLIKELQIEKNMGVIYITHDLGLVAEIADRVVVMYKGEIVETGTVKEIFLNPKHRYTEALIKCRPDAGSKGKRLPVISDFMNETQPEEKNAEQLQTSKSAARSGENFGKSNDSLLLKVENLKVYFSTKKVLQVKFFAKPKQWTT